MGAIGVFGPLVFMVSHDNTLTYNELEETVNTRWANHTPINDAVISEFLGSGQDEKSIKLFLTPYLCQDPDESYKKLCECARTGEHFPVILGGAPLGNCVWYISGINSVSTKFHPVNGSVLWREVTITIKEYN